MKFLSAVFTMTAVFTAVASETVTDYFEHGLGAWKCGRNARWSVAKGEGVGGSDAIVWDGAENEKLKGQGLSRVFPVEPGRSYTYTVKARITRRFSNGRLYLIGDLGKSRPGLDRLQGRPVLAPGRQKGRDWFEMTGHTGRIPVGVTECRVILDPTLEPKGRVLFDDFRFIPGDRRDIEYFTSSAYMNEAFSGRVKFAGSFDFAGDSAQELVAALRYPGSDGQPKTVAAAFPTNGIFTAEIDVADMAIGKQTVLAAIARKGEKKPLMTTRLEFTRLAAPSKREYGYDGHRRFLCEGRPFFPVYLYDVGDDEGAELAKAAGVNTINVHDARELAFAERHGFRVFYSLADINLPNETIRNQVAEVAGHRSIIGWKIGDELSESFARRREEVTSVIHAADPLKRPVGSTHNRAGEPRVFLAGDDYTATDKYPYHGDGTEHDGTWKNQIDTEELVFGMRPRLPIGQAFNWGWHILSRTRRWTNCQYPTREEFQALTWQMLVSGANSTCWYAYSWSRRKLGEEGYARVWAYMKETIAAVAKYQEVFLSAEPVPAAVSSNPRCPAKTWKHDGWTYLAVINLDNTPARTKVGLASGAAGTPETLVGVAPKPAAGAFDYDLPAIGVSFIRWR